MSETPTGGRPRLSCLSIAIILALGSVSGSVFAASSVNAGSGESKIITGNIAATAMGDVALNAHDGGVITGKKATLSSQFNALIRATGGSRIELDGVTMGSSFGPQAYIEDGARVMLSDVTFTSGDVLYVAGAGSQLILENSLSPPSRATFDIRDGGSMALDNVTLEGEPSGSGAAMIRASGGSTAVAITNGSNLLSHDNTVLKLSNGASAILRDSTLSTSPLQPENIGYYPVIRLNPGTALDADNVQLTFNAEGSAISLDDSAVVDIRNSHITGTMIKDAGAAVDAFGVGSKARLVNTDVLISGNMSDAPGQFMGVYAGHSANLNIQGGSIATDGKGISGLQADYASVHLRDVNITTQQTDSAGVVLYGASGDITGGTLMTVGSGSPALDLHDRGALTVSGTHIMAAASEALRMSGGPNAPLHLVLDNARVSGAGRTSLVMQDTGRPQAAGAAVSADLYNGAMMVGDVRVTGYDPRSVFSINLDNAMLSGAVRASGGTTSLSTVNQGIWRLTGDSVLDRFRNGGTVTFAGAEPGTTLHLRGDYTGEGGLLAFRTVLGGDSSVTDRMLVDGSTSGTTSVLVANSGGSGAKTLEGIELIRVQGDSAGEFTQKGPIVAGAYDYRLARGQGENAGNWYLTSENSTPLPPVSPVPPAPPVPPVLPVPHRDPAIRPEAGAYAANQEAANTLFLTRLHDRLGETHYVDTLTGESNVTSLWIRHVGGHNRSRDESGQLATQANRYVLQLGGDVAQWNMAEEGRLHLGVMGGYATQTSRTRNHWNDYRADGSIHGYSAGLYATWLQDNAQKTGAWLDSWAIYSWFDSSVNRSSLATESYKSSGMTASVETGYTWKVGEKNKREGYFVQPVAQLIWMDVTADDHRETNGTWVQEEGAGNVQTRLGVRAFIKGHALQDENRGKTFEPFIEANWLHNTKAFGVSLNGVRVNQAGTGNIAELKAGVDTQLSQHLSLWGNIAQQIGDSGYSDTSGMLGVKASF
ncbi:autotransporter outer membrane beta-barrel domain-containing protein [Enterobacter asburiae]|uniref:autotransporter outer membrane beta-barrel domain-containing protein n=1 Tax=Scandinavium sp. UTDF21-P1B TaxID=3446379 RepID=UPI003474F3AA